MPRNAFYMLAEYQDRVVGGGLYLEDGSICLVNKAYIVCVSHLTTEQGVEPHWLPEVVEIGETSA